MNIIGISGPAGAGKDTIANVLVEEYGFVRRGFADPLYPEVASAFGVTEAFLRHRPTKETPMPAMSLKYCKDPEFIKLYQSLHLMVGLDTPISPRRVMQIWGTEYRRIHSGNEDYWVDKMIEWIDASENKNIVIPDTRLHNEAIFVREIADGKIIHVVRNVAKVVKHASEEGFAFNPGTDIRIENYGTIEELQQSVRSVMDPVNGKRKQIGL